MTYRFKEHTIQRTCKIKYTNYTNYKAYLRKDFSNRCAYCNLHDEAITTPFEIDHYIPKTAFESSRPELKTDYDNLVYSCKKCNRAKSNKFEGDINQTPLDNNLFYNPSVVDYNTIFFRDEYGFISSADTKGKNMIKLLRLHRPIHNLAWFCERLAVAIDKLQNRLEKEEQTSDLYRQLADLKNKLLNYYYDLNNYFIANYNKDLPNLFT